MQQNGGPWGVFLVALLIGALVLTFLVPIPADGRRRTPTHSGEMRAHTGVHHTVEEQETVLSYLVRRAGELLRPLHLRG